MNMERREPRKEPREYNFDEGLREALRRIDVLLSQKKYAVVGLDTSGAPNLGKSYLLGEIINAMRSKGVPFLISELASDIYGPAVKSFLRIQKNEDYDGGLIILNATGCGTKMPEQDVLFQRRMCDRQVAKAGEELGLEIDKVDLLISIYRPDRPVSEMGENPKFAGDIVICNEKAVDDSRKFGLEQKSASAKAPADKPAE